MVIIRVIRLMLSYQQPLSLSSAMLLIKKYGDHLQIDIPASTVVYGENLVAEMIKAEENQIQIYEVQSCM